MMRISLLLALSLAIAPTNVWADDESEMNKIEAESKEMSNHASWDEMVQNKYNLTPEQMKSLRDKGLSNPQIAMSAALAKSSGKPIDEIVKMRVDEKMGWGKIAKELGIHPGEIGRSVAELRHDFKESRKEDRAEKRDERKAARKLAREERRENRSHEKHGRGRK